MCLSYEETGIEECLCFWSSRVGLSKTAREREWQHSMRSESGLGSRQNKKIPKTTIALCALAKLHLF